MSNESIKDTISLLVITLVAGLLLGVVYEITKKPITDEQQRAKEEAYKEVFVNADSFEEIKVNPENAKKLLAQNGYDATINEVMKVLDESRTMVGYVLTITNHEGYGGDIQFAMGVQTDGTVNGLSFLSISETAGLGMKAAEETFMKQFSDKKVEMFQYTKNGASADGEIDAISGATITTSAVVNGVNAGLYYISTLE